MSIFNPIIWVPYIPWAGVAYIFWDAFSTAFNTSSKLLAGTIYLTLYLLASFWQGQVTDIVPEPYLDEIFHIPQAQAYCTGDFHIWDPKLTTPPGLYAFTTVFGNLGGIRSCNVYTLRLFNTLVLIATMAYAGDCRALITRAWRRESKDERGGPEQLSPNVMHTAFNIALFPPLFFFSGLFYTDVLSTCVVLRMYRLYLERKGSTWLYIAGILALTMRQTNIFWVALFMGGLEAVRTLESIENKPAQDPPEVTSWKGAVFAELDRYSRGEIHDISLKDAVASDFLLCAISIGIAVISHPILILRRIWPYITLLISFAGFVYWNGGVVLGDKSNHVATIHLPQLLYLSAFTAFFSFPLLLPSLISLLHPILTILIPSRRAPRSEVPTSSKGLIDILTLLLWLAATLLIIHFNTLIHPFTLADNRHYVFYVFRYTILFHPLIRYLLAPIYMLCSWLGFRALSDPVSTSPSTNAKASSPAPSPPPTKKPISANSPVYPRLHVSSNTSPAPDPGPRTSFALILFLTTTLTLTTAPLVEPRYFILPWLIWRLHVPSWSPLDTTPKVTPRVTPRRKKRGVGILETMYGSCRDYDHRLWMETAWFLGVNAVTGWVFLWRGFEWVQEPGEVQRFMW